MGFYDLLNGLAWPIVALVLGTIYKPQIVSFLPNLLALFLRSRKLELMGMFKVEVDAAEQQKTASTDVTTTELKELPGLPRTPGIARVERHLHAKLMEITENREDVLVRNLAQARLEADFGICYSNIFGSQLAGLIELNARRRVPASHAYDFYVEAERKYPEVYKDYGFAGWLGFLKSNNLIEADRDDVVMTDIGDDFLLWLRTKHLSTNRPF